jgi:hypothetical protein
LRPTKDFDGVFDYWDSSETLEDEVLLAFIQLKIGLRPWPVDDLDLCHLPSICFTPASILFYTTIPTIITQYHTQHQHK